MVGFLGGVAGGASISIVISAVDKFSKTFNSVNKAMMATGAAITGFGVAGSIALGSLAKEAAKTVGVQKAFNKMMGKDSVLALSRLTSATRGTVSQIDLMTQANQAMLLGIDPDMLPEMFEGALAAAQATGQPISKAIQDITTGIGRQSKLILDNLGIMVNVETANNKYAESLGKASSELSDMERKAAFMNATMEALRINQQKIGEVTDDANIKLQRMGARFDDLKLKIGTQLLPVFEKLLNLGDKVLTFMESNQIIQNYGADIAVIGTAAALIIGPLTMLVAILPSLVAGLKILGIVSAGAFAVVALKVVLAVAAIALLIKVFMDLKKKWPLMVNDAQRFAHGVANTFRWMANVVLKVWNSVINTIQDGINKAINMINSLIRQMNRIPGVSINTIQDVNFDKLKASEFQMSSAPLPMSREAPIQVNIENVVGLDPEDISKLLSDELNNKISL